MISLSINQAKAVAELKSKFIHADEIIDMIVNCYLDNLSNKKAEVNIILEGPPGHAKSDIARALGTILCEDSVMVYAMNSEITPTKFLGDYNLDKLVQDNVLELNREKSVISVKYAILEEMLDGSKTTLLSLKQVVESGVTCDGKTCTPNDTLLYIACTNVATTSFGTDNTTQAVLERFVYRIVVEWPSYNIEDYLNMFVAQYGSTHERMEELGTIAQFITWINNQQSGSPMTPRTAMKFSKLLLNRGKSAIRGFDGINGSFVKACEQQYEALCGGNSSAYKVKMLNKATLTLINAVLTNKSRTSENLMEAAQLLENIKRQVEDLTVGEEYPDTYQQWSQTRESLNRFIPEFTNAANKLLDKEAEKFMKDLEVTVLT